MTHKDDRGVNLHITSRTDSRRKIPFSDKLGYGLGNFSTGVGMQVVNVFLLLYCTDILRIPASFVGIALSLGVVWDAVTDPAMGFISDKTKSRRFGRRHLYLLIGGIGIGITNFIFWNIDTALPTSVKFTIVLIDLLAIKTFMTIYVTPYTALGAELSNDFNERTAIQSIKTVFFLVGLAFVSVVGMSLFFKPTADYPHGQLNPSAYGNMGLFTSMIIIIFAVLCYFLTKKYIPYLIIPEESNVKRSWASELSASFKQIFVNKSFLYVAMAYMFINTASGILTNTGLHVFTYTFAMNSNQISIILAVQLVVSIISQPAWTLISKKIDKKPAMNLGIILCLIASLIFLLMVFFKDLIRGSVTFFIPFAILGGFGTGGLFTLPLSMVADVIDVDELHTGKRTEGSYYGSLTLLYKMSQSFTLLILGFVLDAINFKQGSHVQTDSTVVILGITVASSLIITFALAFLSLRRYKLNRSTVEDIQRRIAEKNKNIDRE